MNHGATLLHLRGAAGMAAIYRKISWRLLPLLMLCCVMATIDRERLKTEGTDPVEAMTDAIQGLLDDPDGRDRLARLALERSRRFTWASAARSLLDCFEELGPRRAAPGRRTR